MFTYDAFAFSQTTFVLFLILALGSAYELALQPEPSPQAVRAVVGTSQTRLDRAAPDVSN
jgi:hypothetical protein